MSPDHTLGSTRAHRRLVRAISSKVNPLLPQLSEFLCERTQWITNEWIRAVARQTDIRSADHVTHEQLVDHLPALFRDLTERLKNGGQERVEGEAQHAYSHGRHRWQQGYKLEEIIRETSLIRRIVSLDCFDDFARTRPDFDSSARGEAEAIVHQFFSDMLVESAEQFAEEREKEVRASEQNLQAILDSALDCIIVIGEDGRVQEWNPAAERMFCYPRAEAIGQELAQLIIPANLRDRHRHGMRHYLATGEGPLLGKRIEVPAIRSDSSELLVELAITPSRVNGKAVFTAYLRDITARKAGEEATQLLAAIVESSSDAIISKDLNGTIMSWNKGAQRLFGYTAEEAIGKPVTMLIPPERHEEEPQILARIRRGERIEKYETIRRRKDGSTVNVSLTASPIKDREGNVIGASKIGHDITERVQQEARRAAQYAIAAMISGTASLVETGSQILETVGRSGRWIFGALWVVGDERKLFCHSTWRTTGRELEQFQADTQSKTFPAGEGLAARAIASGRPAWIADVTLEPEFLRRETARASGLHGALLFPLLAPSGVNGVIELFSDAVLAPDEDLLRLVGALGIEIGLYIERNRIEDELRQQKEKAEAANRAKDRFLAALSHELRTPLTPVLMWACATLHDETLGDNMREGLEMVCRNVQMEARLIDDLLDLTRISHGKLKLNLQPCRADALLQHALEIVRSQLARKKLHVSVELKASNHQLVADPTRIEQVFWNLLANAHKFTPENGEIIIRSYDLPPDMVAFEIGDTGRGIDPELMPKLFTAFEQGINGREGLGLGLAICKAIVQMHGGEITGANKEDGSGAVFTVTLSSVVGHGVDAPLADTPTVIPRRKLNILLVEDHVHTAAVMSMLLKRSGHDVVTAATVRQALGIVRSTPLDVLVSDLGLPDGDGFQVMRELAEVSDAKGIAVSGYGMEDDIERSTAAGFSAHLTKPIDAQELEETIQRVGRES